MSNFSQKATAGVGKIVSVSMERPLRRKLSKMDLPKQVLYARKVLKLSGIPEMRRNLLSGIGDEFADDIAGGKTGSLNSFKE